MYAKVPGFTAGLCLLFSLLGAPAAAADKALTELEARLAAILPPGVKPDAVRPAQIPGLFEIVIGDHLFYAASDGPHLFLGSGDLIDTGKGVNLSDQRRAELEARRGKRALTALEKLGEEQMIVFAGPQPKRTLTVFTDVDCPYCVRFHRDVPALVAAGVKVRYLLFPRNGLESPTYARSVAVWCASDRADAIGIAKAGGKLEMRTCPNPVADIYRLGKEVGVSGTPTLITDAGQIIPGALPAARLLAMLGLAKAEAAAK